MLIFANPLKPLISIAESILVFLHNEVGFGWGMSIVMLTVVVRLLIMPLTVKQFHSMQAMQRLQPQIKEIQAKYKGDRQKMNQEMMKFYQENKVNPLGSCLPLVLQFPVFIALFYLLRHDLAQHLTDTRGWLFIDDLTHAAVGAPLVVLIVLYVATQLGSSLLMAAAATDKSQQRMMMILPLVFVVFIIRFPAGLIVYWITTNLWTVGQQLVLKRLVATHPVPVTSGAAVALEGKPPPPPRTKKKRSGRRP